MSEDSANQAAPAVPEELNAALQEVIEWVDARSAASLRMDTLLQLRFARRRLPVEVAEPTVDTTFWEMALYFITREAQEQGPGGQRALDAARRLEPLLREYLGGPGEEVTLREITAKTVFGICLLSDTLTEPKRRFVAPNDISLAQAHFNPHAWFRAIYAGRTPVGFMMIVDDDEEHEYFLWRFMVAGIYQGRGYGRQAIERLVEYIRTRPGARELGVSCGLGEGSPEGFYLRQGFVSTGKMEEGEMVLVRQLG